MNSQFQVRELVHRCAIGTGCGDKYKDLDTMLLAYGKAIGNNPKRHEEVMALLQWAKDNNVL